MTILIAKRYHYLHIVQFSDIHFDPCEPRRGLGPPTQPKPPVLLEPNHYSFAAGPTDVISL